MKTETNLKSKTFLFVHSKFQGGGRGKRGEEEKKTKKTKEVCKANQEEHLAVVGKL